VQPRLHRPHRHPQRRGNLRQAHLRHIPHEQHLALRIVKPIHNQPQRGTRFRSIEHGRSSLIESLAAIATQALVDARPAHIAISGASGAGKTRVLDAVCERLRAAGHEVIGVRGRRRFAGELADDPVCEALGGDLAPAVEQVAARGALIAIDDAMWIPASTLGALDRALARGATKLAVLTASAAPLGDREASHRVDVVLPPLAFSDAEVLVRELLRPARLIPRVLVERLAIRANGSPGLLVALAGEITRRGAVRRNVGSQVVIALQCVQPGERPTRLESVLVRTQQRRG
jgi:hypothetical protein